MSWYSKVAWLEGLFLRPQHLQQTDRYLEHLIDARTRHVTPYPWGFSHLEIDLDMAQQSKFCVRHAAGIMPDGTPFDIPNDSPLPDPIDVPTAATRQIAWLSLPVKAPNTREVDAGAAESASRFTTGSETFIDSTSMLRVETEIDVAYPRLSFDLRKTPKPGFVCLAIAEIIEVSDKKIIFDQKFVPPVLSCAAHPVVQGWLDRVIGWVENKLEELARYAADPTSGGGLQSVDYFVLQLLNRNIPILRHLRASAYIHPERLYQSLLGFAGELATFSTEERRAHLYPAYDHDHLEATFAPLISDIQVFLSYNWTHRAIRLDIVQVGPTAFKVQVPDRSLFRTATFVLEVESRRPAPEIQSQFPRLFKLGPETRMGDIVYRALPGIPLVHMPSPPRQIRVLVDHVYFYLDRKSPMWPEFTADPAIGMHFSGDWPDLRMDLWAILEGSR